MTGLYITGGVAVLVLFIGITWYNRLTRSRNQIENAISSLDALFIKRSDLIPNLVTVVKQYMNFEEQTLEKITAMRGTDSRSNQQTEKEGREAMKNLMIQVENYPDLKANTQFSNLQYSWNEVEEQIAAGRRYVSSAITIYNNTVQAFPGNVVSKLSGHSTYEWVYAEAAQRENVDAKNLFS